MVKRKLDGAVDESSANQEIRKSDMTVHNLWKIFRPPPSGTEFYCRQEVRQSSRWNLGRFEILKACCRRSIRFSTYFSQDTAAFLWHFQCFFFRQTLLQGCFIECEILQSPMNPYHSLLSQLMIYLYVYLHNFVNI